LSQENGGKKSFVATTQINSLFNEDHLVGFLTMMGLFFLVFTKMGSVLKKLQI